MKVYLAQVLCPSRHAFVMYSGECDFWPEDREAAIAAIEQFAMEQIRQSMTDQPPGYIKEQWPNISQLLPKCHLCGAGIDTWKVEVTITPFASLEEAKPHLAEAQLEQMLTRLAIDREKASRN